MDSKTKEKFIIKKELKNFNINYDIDNSLLKPIFNSKEKNKIELINNINPTIGIPNTGSGGGGSNQRLGAAGGSGLVVIRYKNK